MSSTVNPVSPLSISDANLPIALRPAIDFPPVRASIFDDPGDEKSWHASQRSDALSEFYADRDPSWYRSAIAPLKGADRVLDLGCGPGLTLQALLDQGCTSVLGVDRWPAFVANSTPEAPIVAHDLTLPMPFLESGSFDGVLSHYALDYVSPICMRQVLREAHRLLAPGGRLVVYVAAIGLGGGDEARTVSYSPTALRTLLSEAGFDEIDVRAASGGRNSIARAQRSAKDLDFGRGEAREAVAEIAGDTQVSAAFTGEPEAIRCELTSRSDSATFVFALPPAESAGDRVSVCARALRSVSGGTELQVWVWRGFTPIAIECARVELDATEMRLSSDEGCQQVSVWCPGELSLEPPGNAYTLPDDLPRGDALGPAERGEEGRQIVVEPAQAEPVDEVDLGPGRNRFLVGRASALDLDAADRMWLAGRLHGIALSSSELDKGRMRELLLWAGWRQSLIFLGGLDWVAMLAAASQREAELQGPVVLVDPALSGAGPARALPPELAAFAQENDRRFVLLGGEGRDRSARADLQSIRRRLLHGGSPGSGNDGLQEAGENLRHLTERTLLMRLRQARGFSPAEVGRRSSCQ
ncbi:MAG TPA: class I SAM-dependent methyltransferase [Solirubrobacterales bacterium]